MQVETGNYQTDDGERHLSEDLPNLVLLKGVRYCANKPTAKMTSKASGCGGNYHHIALASWNIQDSKPNVP